MKFCNFHWPTKCWIVCVMLLIMKQAQFVTTNEIRYFFYIFLLMTNNISKTSTPIFISQSNIQGRPSDVKGNITPINQYQKNGKEDENWWRHPKLCILSLRPKKEWVRRQKRVNFSWGTLTVREAHSHTTHKVRDH